MKTGTQKPHVWILLYLQVPHRPKGKSAYIYVTNNHQLITCQRTGWKGANEPSLANLLNKPKTWAQARLGYKWAEPNIFTKWFFTNEPSIDELSFRVLSSACLLNNWESFFGTQYNISLHLSLINWIEFRIWILLNLQSSSPTKPKQTLASNQKPKQNYRQLKIK